MAYCPPSPADALSRCVATIGRFATQRDYLANSWGLQHSRTIRAVSELASAVSGRALASMACSSRPAFSHVICRELDLVTVRIVEVHGM
jgi:hypothetical protein